MRTVYVYKQYRIDYNFHTKLYAIIEGSRVLATSIDLTDAYRILDELKGGEE